MYSTPDLADEKQDLHFAGVWLVYKFHWCFSFLKHKIRLFHICAKT